MLETQRMTITGFDPTRINSIRSGLCAFHCSRLSGTIDPHPTARYLNSPPTDTTST
jgi:hypothetical protein